MNSLAWCLRLTDLIALRADRTHLGAAIPVLDLVACGGRSVAAWGISKWWLHQWLGRPPNTDPRQLRRPLNFK